MSYRPYRPNWSRFRPGNQGSNSNYPGGERSEQGGGGSQQHGVGGGYYSGAGAGAQGGGGGGGGGSGGALPDIDWAGGYPVIGKMKPSAEPHDGCDCCGWRP